MKIGSRVAGFVRSLIGRRAWLWVEVAVAVTVLAPLLVWGQSTAWQFSGGTASVTGVNVGIGMTNPNTLATDEHR